MGGHGALTLALRHSGRFRSVSALAPICAPSEVPWGVKAFSGYLGEDRAAWSRHDASALIAALAGGAVITAAAVRGASMGTIATAMAVTALGLLFLAVFMRHRMPMIEPGALLIART